MIKRSVIDHGENSKDTAQPRTSKRLLDSGDTRHLPVPRTPVRRQADNTADSVSRDRLQRSGCITVGNERGVHSRIATGLAEIAASHQVQLYLTLREETADCSMILDVLALGCVQGDELAVLIEGDAADMALEAVEALLTAKEDPK